MKIYLADTDPLKNQILFEKMLSQMPSCRKSKVLRMPEGINRRQSLGAGILLSIALSAKELTEEQTKTGPYGKPYLPEAEQLFFNLSHSGNRVMCAVADTPVGCDVQQIRDIPEFGKIAKRFFTPEETAEIERLPEEEGKELFFRYWTLKESYIKASGMGLSMPLNRFCLRMKEDGSVTLADSSNDEVAFWESDSDDGYRYACCLLNETALIKPETEWIDFSTC